MSWSEWRRGGGRVKEGVAKGEGEPNWVQNASTIPDLRPVALAMVVEKGLLTGLEQSRDREWRLGVGGGKLLPGRERFCGRPASIGVKGGVWTWCPAAKGKDETQFQQAEAENRLRESGAEGGAVFAWRGRGNGVSKGRSGAPEPRCGTPGKDIRLPQSRR